MKQNPNSSKSTVLALLVFIFILPGCLALMFYQHPQWLGSRTANHGQLISPFVKLDGLSSPKYWHLLLVTDKACDKQCLTTLDKLARVRLALGRLSREVDLRLMVSKADMLPNKAIRAQMKDMAMAAQVLLPIDQQRLTERNFIAGLFIVDPRGYMVLSYPIDTKQKPIYQDLKHLIKIANQ